LWLGFSGTDINTDLHYSDWFELNVIDEEDVFIDLDSGISGWNNASGFAGFGMISNCQDGTPLEFQLTSGMKLSRCKHSGIIPAMNMLQDQIGSSAKSELGTATELEAWEQIEGKEIVSVDGKLGVLNSQTLPYTKLTFVDHPAMTSSLENFGGANLAYIAMIDSPTKPNATGEGTKIFGAGSRIDLSCKECGTVRPTLRLVNATQNKTHNYLANIYKQDGSCGTDAHKASYIEGENWFNAPNVYLTLNAGAPLQQHQFTELYFTNGDDKLKLDELGC